MPCHHHTAAKRRVRRVAFDQRHALLRFRQPLRAPARCDDRHRKTQCLDQLALDAAAKAQRQDRGIRRPVQPFEHRIGDIAGDQHVAACQPRYRRRRERAGEDCAHLRYMPLH